MQSQFEVPFRLASYYLNLTDSLNIENDTLIDIEADHSLHVSDEMYKLNVWINQIEIMFQVPLQYTVDDVKNYGYILTQAGILCH